MSNEATKQAVSTVLSDYLRVAPGQRLWCFTDDARAWLAASLADRAMELGLAVSLINLSGDGSHSPESVRLLLSSLSETDIAVSVLSYGPLAMQYSRVFPSFRPPEGFPGRSALIRQRYPDDALLSHLATPTAAAEAAADRALAHGPGRVRITAPSGTDLVCDLKPAVTLPYRLGAGQRHVYLPPAEVAYGVVPGSAKGVIVADVTAGEFVVRDEIYDSLGRVDGPVCLSVRDGRVTESGGGDIACRLAACFDRLDREQPEGSDGRLVIELGFGLSIGTPVGLGAPDECLQGTCHFGIGNDFFFGGANAVPMHMDVVVQGPVVVTPAR